MNVFVRSSGHTVKKIWKLPICIKSNTRYTVASPIYEFSVHRINVVLCISETQPINCLGILEIIFGVTLGVGR